MPCALRTVTRVAPVPGAPLWIGHQNNLGILCQLTSFKPDEPPQLDQMHQFAARISAPRKQYFPFSTGKLNVGLCCREIAVWSRDTRTEV